MKRSEAIKTIVKELVDQLQAPQSLNTACIAHDILFRLEALGMLPPINTCHLVPHEDGSTKHSSSKREWDEEV